jgi:hypothetical protein
MFRALLAYQQGAYNCAKQLFNCFVSRMWQNCWKFLNMQELVFYNIIVILIKMCAFVGLNCNNWIIMQGIRYVYSFIFRPNLHCTWKSSKSELFSGATIVSN